MWLFYQYQNEIIIIELTNLEQQLEDKKNVSTPYINLSGASGITSETKELDAGKYKIVFFVTTFSWWDRCPSIQVYCNSVLKLDTKGSVICDADAGGSYQPYGIVTLFRLE